MNRNLYLKELKRSRKSLFVWTAIVIVLTLLITFIFPYMKSAGEEIALMMSKMPEGMVKALGMNDQSFSTMIGVYNSYYSIYIIVLLSIYTSSQGATILSKEEKNKTSEFLLTKPISRKSIFTTKLLSLSTLLSAAFLTQTMVAFTCVSIFGEHVRWSVFTTMHVHGLMLLILFTCIGLFISMLSNPRKNFTGIMVGVVFGSYFLNSLAKATDAIHYIAYLSPFHYLHFSVSDPGYAPNPVTLCVTLLISTLLTISSFKIFNKKDIDT